MKDTSWAHALEVTADGSGLVGHAGAVLLRQLADRLGLTAALDKALTVKGTFPQLSRGMVLVSTAIAIALGATAMAGIEVLGQLAPVLGPAPSDSTVRRVLDLASYPVLARIAQARARIRKHAWALIAATGRGFPWIAVAGKTLEGWLVIDMDATLVTACSDKGNARPVWKMGYGFHPLAAWCINTRECLDMLLRPGNAGSNTFEDHKEVLTAALKQVPASFRRRILVRIDGAGASHKLLEHLLTLTAKRRALLFTCGWIILDACEQAIASLPETAWQPGLLQDGGLEDDKDCAEITHLMTRAGDWPSSLRFIARRVKPSRRHKKKMTALEKKTGGKYSITCTNIGHTGMTDVPGSQHPSSPACSSATTPPPGPTASAPPRPWDCATCHPGHTRSARAGSSPRTWPPTSPPGRASSASTTRENSATPPPARSAAASGASPPASSATPASGSSRSAPTGPGSKPSWPAGSAPAPSRHPADQHQPPRRQGRRRNPAAWKPVPPRAHRAAPRATRQVETDMKAKNALDYET
jgi:cytochrome c1